jgi:hypothetical protein
LNQKKDNHNHDNERLSGSFFFAGARRTVNVGNVTFITGAFDCYLVIMSL